ncbi:hypothetical protein QKW60_04745 [Defluviimonas aestuarii]|uniref:hypothetical protein n=1 Tax=Albidovulum aestuarii TaxID=1130726 RepID=UPI00249B6C9C|nr:hypothetical protein [Defluviimonas aestuarii]MDI3335701.1 hypothetical protein [Defluviimonas aestuarii]
MHQISYARHRFPPVIILHAVWLSGARSMGWRLAHIDTASSAVISSIVGKRRANTLSLGDVDPRRTG